MGSRSNEVPSFYAALGVALQMRAPDAETLGIGVVRRDSRAANLAPAPGLVWLAWDGIEVQPGLVRCRVTPLKVRRFEVHGMHKRAA